MKNVKTTISTYDTEKGTTIKKTSVDLFEYHELSDDARARVIDDLISDCEYWLDEDFRNYESEIWDCVHDFEKSIDIADIKLQYNPWYSCDFDINYKINDIDWLCPDEMEPVKDNGYCYSFDLADTWNNHARRLNAIARAYNCMVDIQMNKYPANEWEANGDSCNSAFYYRLEDLTSKLNDQWIIELEKACQDVANTLQGLLQSEWDYCHSREYAETLANDEVYTGGVFYTVDDRGRKYFSDTRKWFTSLGELFEESNIMHECISIVKAS